MFFILSFNWYQSHWVQEVIVQNLLSESMANSNFPFQIPQFIGENYEYWSIKMKTLLLSQDLWELVENGFNEPADQTALNALTVDQRTQ
eukprot:Gb_39751 [translate_table: standard]